MYSFQVMTVPPHTCVCLMIFTILRANEALLKLHYQVGNLCEKNKFQLSSFYVKQYGFLRISSIF